MLTRVLTGVIAGGVTLTALLWREPWGTIGLLLAIVLLCSLEIDSLTSSVSSAALLSVLIPLALMPILGGLNIGFMAIAGVLWAGSVVGFALRSHLGAARALLLYWLAPSACFVALLLALQGQDSGSFGPNLLILAWVPLWAGDSLAYFIGKTWGKHPLAPSVSPNKTVEGAVANLAGCVLASWGIGTWMGAPLAAWLLVGLSTGVIGQVGDLLQSGFKRLMGAKDSGRILPGHGGVLDRLDSFFVSVYPSFLALYFFAPDLFHVKHWPWSG